MSDSEDGFPTPREFQVQAREALRQGVRDGHRCQMLMAPTGAGKTMVAMYLINECIKRGKRAMFVCDRRSLIEQTSNTADRYGLDHGIVMADHWRFQPSKQFQIASAQTLARRVWPDEFDLLIIDESHTQLKVWTDHIPKCSAKVIGLSATPFSPGLGKLFSNLVNAATMAQLTELGVLVPMRVLSCTKVNMKDAATSGGEWTDLAAEERGLEIVGDVVSEWQKYADGKKTIVFGATIAHCEEMCRQFNEAGVMASVFCATTTDPERKEILDEYRKPDSLIRVVLSVSALSKGFDVPDVECICDVRPLRKSLSEAIQMWGRGVRSSPETGKDECLLLDFSGNIVRFAKDFEDIYFNGLLKLDEGEKYDKTIRKDAEEEQEARACPKCGYKPFTRRCISCGHEMKAASTIEHEVSAGVVEIMIGKSKAAESKVDLWAQITTYCRSTGKPETAYGRSAHLFRDITGQFPPETWGLRTSPETKPTATLLNKIRANRIRWAKGQQKAKAA